MYHVEIYEPTGPGSDKREVLGAFQSKQPFLSINVGDFINQSFMVRNGAPWTERLRVTEIEHIIWGSNGGVKHKIMVFTETETESPF